LLDVHYFNIFGNIVGPTRDTLAIVIVTAKIYRFEWFSYWEI